jgi:hypothetical protein
MALHYQTEYRLGNRGRICRSYSGFQALIAIVFDLVFGLAFELVTMVFALAVRLVILTTRLVVRVLTVNWKILVAAMTLLVYLLTPPFALLHEAVNRFRSGDESGPDDTQSYPTSNLKPSWALSREV